MPYLQWDENLSVADPTIDEQHKQLLSLINRLHLAMSAGAAHSVMAGLFADLLQYTTEHFTYEEQRMKECDYHGLEDHKLLHEDLKNRVIAHKNRFENERSINSIDVLIFLRLWLLGHISNQDQAYSKYLKSR